MPVGVAAFCLSVDVTAFSARPRRPVARTAPREGVRAWHGSVRHNGAPGWAPTRPSPAAARAARRAVPSIRLTPGAPCTRRLGPQAPRAQSARTAGAAARPMAPIPCWDPPAPHRPLAAPRPLRPVGPDSTGQLRQGEARTRLERKGGGSQRGRAPLISFLEILVRCRVEFLF
jgi:hypothetical protein